MDRSTRLRRERRAAIVVNRVETVRAQAGLRLAPLRVARLEPLRPSPLSVPLKRQVRSAPSKVGRRGEPVGAQRVSLGAGLLSVLPSPAFDRLKARNRRPDLHEPANSLTVRKLERPSCKARPDPSRSAGGGGGAGLPRRFVPWCM